MLELDRLAVRYGERQALAPTSCTLRAGALVGLVGANGAGKSTLLKAIAGLVPSAGVARWDAEPLARLDPRTRARTLAYLPQHPTAHWAVSVRELVALARLPHRAFGSPPTERDLAAVDEAMLETGIAGLAGRPVDELSAGERARAQLARAFAVRAPALLVDEPVTSLDPYYQLEIMAALARYAATGALVIAVLHELALAARFCARLLLMHGGEIVADGAPAAVLDAPALARYYHVEAYLARHEAEPVIVPWRQLD